MNILAKAGMLAKSFAFVRNNPKLRKHLKKIGVLVSENLYPNGVMKNIGGKANFLMSPDFTFCDVEGWGKGKNNGYHKLIELAGENNIVFDIGAHIGICSLSISKVIKEGGTCYAFEPAKANRRYLETHLKMNNVNNVIVVPYFVGDKCDGCVEFYESTNDSGMNSLCLPENKSITYNKIMRKQLTLDSFVARNDCIPGLIKIDVEGAELNVLRGAKTILRRYHPEIIISVHPRHLNILGYSVDELTKEIHDLNYQIYNIGGSLVEGELGSREYYLH